MTKEILPFSQMLCKAQDITPEPGTETGKCCVCGVDTNEGFSKKFGGNFTTADFVSTGDVICKHCKHLVDNSNSYRRTMYYLSEDTFKSFKKQEAKDIIFNLPDKPFYLYLTKTWQKIGWIRMNTVPNMGTSGEIRVLLDYDIIQFKLDNLKETCDFIHKLRELKISKIDLENGVFEMYNFNKLKEEYGIREARRISQKVKSMKGNPVWDLALYLEQ